VAACVSPPVLPQAVKPADNAAAREMAMHLLPKTLFFIKHFLSFFSHRLFIVLLLKHIF
jgi:hypothetical protein